MKKTTKRKVLALLLSIALIATIALGGTLALVMSKTPSLVNTFLSGLDPFGDLVIQKEIEHPFGESYVLPSKLSFAFDVSLGENYAGKLVRTSQGEIACDGEGKMPITVTPEEAVRIYGLKVGTKVTLNELDAEGFTPSGGKEKTITILSGDNLLTYVNSYDPDPVDKVNLTVDGTKVLEGREWQEGDSFTFLLEYKLAGHGQSWKKAGTASVTYELIEVEDPETGEIHYEPKPDFDKFSFTEQVQDITFNTAGEYSFRLSEIEGTISGVTYDKIISYFDVIVGDEDMDGELEIQDVNAYQSASVSYDYSAKEYRVKVTVNNKYAPAGTAVATINIDKTVESKSGESKSYAGYIFHLYREDGSIVKSSGETSAAGETSIELTYDASDAGKTFHYILKEIYSGETRDGMIYDDTAYDLSISVVDNLDGTISALIYETPEETEPEEPKPEEEKEPEAEEPEEEETPDTPPEDTEDEPAETPEPPTEENDPPAEETDDPAEETDEPTETPDAPEEAPEAPETDAAEPVSAPVRSVAADAKKNPTEDSNEADVEVSAEDDLQTPSEPSVDSDPPAQEPDAPADPPSAPAEKPDDSTEPEDPVDIPDDADDSYFAAFVNVYEPTKTKVTIEGTKELSGRGLRNEEFSFALYFTDDDFTVSEDMKPIQTVANDTKGNFAFEEIEYTEIGTYRYVVMEDTSDELGGVAYDNSVYHVIVTVRDNNGTLKASTEITDPMGESAELKFKNSYAPDVDTVILSGIKQLSGLDLNSNMFRFFLYEADKDYAAQGDPVASAFNDAAGEFSFDPITYSEPGTFYYVVKEDSSPGVEGMTYDDTAYGIKISVWDNGDGNLIARVKICVVGGAEVDAIRFVNSYTRPTEPIVPPDDPTPPSVPSDPEVPPTGDDTNLGLYIALLLISAAAIVVLVVVTTKKKRKGRHNR